MPFLPGDGILIVAGVLVANDSFPLWLFLPLACLAVLAGSLVGYSWARALGTQGIRAAAERIGASRALDRAEVRLAGAGPLTIGVARLIPGLRVYTTLVGGAIGVSIRSFLLGVVPAIVVWVTAFTLLGMLVGLPAQHFLGRAGRILTDGVVLLAVGAAGYLALRHIPPVVRGDNAFQHTPRPGQLVIALLVDLAIVGCLVFGIASLVRAGVGIGDVDGFVDVVVIAVLALGSYVAATRGGWGVTGGEALVGVSYHQSGPPPATD